MNCSEVEKFLPLYAGHDLGARREQSVTAHLQSCATCSSAAAEYRAAQDLLRDFTPPAFSDEVFAEIRKCVRQQIETESRVPSFFEAVAAWFQPRLVWTAAAALLVILSVVGVYLSAKKFTVRPDAIANVPEVVLEPLNRSAEKLVTNFSDADKRTTGPRQADVPRRQRKPGRMVAPDQVGSVAEYSPDAQATKIDSSSPVIGTENVDLGDRDSSRSLRMEIQTGDPNIRIIWFTQSDSKPVAHSKGT